MTAFDTDEPQGSSPTSSSEEKFEGGGAGLNLDRLDDWARETIAYEELGAAKDGLVITEAWDEWFRATQVLALVERVRILEAALERIASGNPVLYGAARIAAAALSAAGGPDGQ